MHPRVQSPRARRRTAVVAISVSALVAGLLALATPSPAVAAPGDLDPSWDGDGIATTAFNAGGDDEGNAAAALPDGSVVVAGKAFDGTTDTHMGIAKYRADGTLDPAFNGSGTVEVPFFFGDPAGSDTNGDEAFAVAVTPGGDILAAGSASRNDGSGALAVARYNANGTPDTGFGGGTGRATVEVGADGLFNKVNAIGLQPDGKIVIAGIWANGWVVARLTETGVLDTTFNAAGPQPGTRQFDLGSPFFDNAAALVIEPGMSPDIVVGGSGAEPASPAGTQDFAVVRLNNDGTFDTGFDGDGIVKTDLGDAVEEISSLVWQPDGKVLAAGQAGPAGGPTTFTLARYLADGSLDTTFDTDGIATIPGSLEPGSVSTGLGLLGDGSILAASTTATDDVLVAKLNSAGAPEAGFGTGGVVTTDVNTDHVGDLVIDASGRAVVAGRTDDGASTTFLTTRYLTGAQPTVDTQPSAQNACGSDTATFTVSVSGPTPQNHQWQRSTDGGATFADLADGPGVAGATTDTLTLTGLTGADNGHQFRAVVSTGGGTVTSSPATLTAGTAPSITTQPSDKLRSDGAQVSFAAAASGSPSPDAQWQTSTDGGTIFGDILGETADTYTTTATLAEDGHQFRAEYTNDCGTATSDAATLTVLPVTDQQVIVSEFRLVGPAGDRDWYVNVHNPTSETVNLSGWTVEVSHPTDPPTSIGLTNGALPPGTTKLVAGDAFSLGGYAAADQTAASPAAPGGGVRISGPNGTVTDRAGMDSAAVGLFEGTAIPQPTTGSGELALTRKVQNGAYTDTNNNAADFLLVASNAATESHGPSTTLGAPAPRNLAAPRTRNDIAQSFLFDPSVSASQPPNRVVSGSFPNKTLSIRRRIENTGSTTITAMRLRITQLTTHGNATASQAILTAQSSTTSGALQGLTLEVPPSNATGGGIGASLLVPLPPGGLAPGASVNVDITFNAVRGGSYVVGYSVEIS